MAGTLLVKDLIRRVCTDLDDLDPQFNRWSQKELVDALNDGQRAIAKYLPHSCSRVDAIKLVAGTKQGLHKIPAASLVMGDGSLVRDLYGNSLLSLVRNMGNNGLTPGKSLKIVDRDMLDAVSSDWHTKTATAPSEYTYDPRTPKVFYVNPGVPVAASVWVEAAYLVDPSAVPNVGDEDYGVASTSTTKLSIDDVNLEDLLNYIVARANMKESDAANPAVVVMRTQMFVSSLNAQATASTGVNPNLKSLPFSMQTPATAQ